MMNKKNHPNLRMDFTVIHLTQQKNRLTGLLDKTGYFKKIKFIKSYLVNPENF